MAICFVRSRYVSRSTGGNACNSSAYNARSKIIDERTGEIFDYTQKEDDAVYHEVLLPGHVDKKYKDISILSNEVEANEHRKDSQLYIEWVLALPKEEEITLEMKKELVYRFIKYKNLLDENLGVQIDIHAPHDNKDNWHAHLLVTTRRFTEDGFGFEKLKARDLQPKVVGGRVVEETKDSIAYTAIQNEYFKECGLDLRVDLPGEITQEHVGPVRMRSVINEAAMRNEERKESNVENLNSGKKLLKVVSDHLSVFNKADLRRAVKIIPDDEVRKRLVEEALSSKSLVSLFDENGRATGYYTTDKVRAEEMKLLRLAGYVAATKNVISMGGVSSINSTSRLIAASSKVLSKEQHSALSHLLLDDSGLRILRGRAGTGKSHVLGKVADIANTAGVNVIGLAPTHKARCELAAVGYKQNDTVKGMLFKLHNGRFYLPKHSLLVVDEAGMIGNDDLKELKRVAATRKCNVILSGDEKQSVSVQRGGMFEVFSECYGSATLLDIQRQKDAWGREVAVSFSSGAVKSGLSILQENKAISEHISKAESMNALLADWNKSSESVKDKLILAVKNKDVAALNHGARQYLKLEGVLQGKEYEVAGGHYMKGDRIMIRKTEKDLGLINGDFATVLEVSEKRFVIKMENDTKGSDNSNDNHKIVEFNPSEYTGFRHGYASTVFKAQGASIFDVFVFHDGFAGIRNSYVSLSRHVKNLRLYINQEATKSIEHLVKQLGHDPEIGSSLSYLTKQELDAKLVEEHSKNEKNIVGSLVLSAMHFARRKITVFTDKYLADSEYYQYKAPIVQPEKVREVLDATSLKVEQEYIENVVGGEVKRAIAVGEGFLPANASINNGYVKAINSKVINNNVISNIDTNAINRDVIKSSVTSTDSVVAKNVTNSTTTKDNSSKLVEDNFYKESDYAMRKAEQQMQLKAEWHRESETLRSEVKYSAERIAYNLLGEPNKSLSNRSTLRFCEDGKIAVCISGSKQGMWYDFSTNTGGDMFALVQDNHNCDFKEAAEYLRGFLGIESSALSNHLRLVHDQKNSNLTEENIKARRAEEKAAKAKAQKVEKLYARAKVINSESVAYRYLSQERAINCNLGNDIKSAGIYVSSEVLGNRGKQGRYIPSIIAFARDKNGNVTGGQQILLNKYTCKKANIAVPKRSFGKIAGSFVNVGAIGSGDNDISQSKEKITIIAEGLETALSVKQALGELREHRNDYVNVICSLGISNIRNYPASAREKIIIAADNDGTNSNTSKTIANAQQFLQEKGAFVEVIRPEKAGDFNDVLKLDGIKSIQESLRPVLITHAPDVSRFDANLAKFTKQKDGAMNIQELKPIIVEEQKFLAETYKLIKDPISERRDVDTSINLQAAELSANKPEMLQKVFDLADSLNKNFGNSERKLLSNVVSIIKNEHDLLKELKNTTNIDKTYVNLDQSFEAQNINRKIVKFNSEKRHAKTTDEVIDVLKKKQEFLAKLDKNLKYPKQQEKLLELSQIAKSFQLEKIPDKLNAVVKQSIDLGIRTETSLVQELRNIENSKDTYVKLDAAIEIHNVNSQLSIFNKQRHIASTPKEAMNVLRKEQKFLSNLHGNLKYSDSYNDEFMKLVHDANKNEKNNVVNDLHNLSKFLEKKSFDNAIITTRIKESYDPKTIHKNLLSDYHKHFVSVINKSLDSLKKGNNVSIDKKVFSCPINLMEHIVRHHSNKYTPHKEVEKIQNKVIENQKQKVISKDMQGPSL